MSIDIQRVVASLHAWNTPENPIVRPEGMAKLVHAAVQIDASVVRYSRQ